MAVQQQKILIIDDDRAVCASISLLLKKRGFHPEVIYTPQVALDTVGRFRPDLVLLDMNFSIDTSGKQGIRILELLMDGHPDLPVILMTGWATVQLAVRGMKLGAKDFLAKPWDNDHLISSIKTVLSLYGSQKSPVTAEENTSNEIIGKSDSLVEVLDMVQRVAPTHASVLITGESGTGKELVAEAIHQLSHRKDQEFVKVNLGGISTSLFESEMFGHKKGAFTDAIADRQGRFAKAHKGTIFLDEIGELPPSNQVKLLRVLQEHTFEVLGSSERQKTDVRVISATNKSLEDMVRSGLFREDLYYRINLLTIHLPALRERREDIPLLAQHFISKICMLYEIELPRLTDETIEYLSNQSYPGNIRQLKNIVDRTILLNLKKKELTWKDFMTASPVASDKKLNLPQVGDMTLEQLEIEMIKKALSFHNHSISQSAQSLGITRSSLYRRLEKYNIPYESKI
jgi:DNA-binding NtrC family response regulator